MLDAIAKWWCRTFHEIRHGGQGQYECKDCLRRFDVPWAISNADYVAKRTAVGR